VFALDKVKNSRPGQESQKYGCEIQEENSGF
jgi:hypothetical protein